MQLQKLVNMFGGDLTRRYGQKVHKLTLHGGFSCPNRDGTIGRGGCTFCNVASFADEAQQHRSETVLQTSEGVLVIRALYGNHSLTCAPDLNGLPITINRDTAPSERVVLDFDHYWETQNDPVSFEVDDVLKRLRRLHDTSREAFWNITTDYARNEKWA